MRLEKALTVLVLAGAIVVLLLLQLLPSRGGGGPASVYSNHDAGLRAAYLVLDELGFEPRGWTRSPGHLPRSEVLLVLSAVPETPPAYAALPASPGREQEVDLPRTSRRQRDPRHYLRFVEEGGRLLLMADEEELAFLRETLGLAEFDELEVVPDEEPVRQTLLLSDGERLEVDWRPDCHFAPLPVTTSFEIVAADEEGRPRCVRLEVGRGEIAVLAPGDTPFSNESIGQGDNALFLIRLVEELAPRREVLFDEYALGGWVPDSALDLAFSAESFEFSLHLLSWGLIALWLVVRIRSFPRDPEPLGQVSAVLRARGFAGMLVSAGRWDLLARMLRVGVVRRLSARVGLRRRAAPEHGERSEALAEESVRPLLRRLRPGASAEELDELTALLAGERVRDGAGLERIASGLGELETAMLAPTAAQVRTSA